MKEDNNITKEGTEAILQVLRVFQQISDASAKTCIRNMPEQIVKLSRQINQAEAKQKQSLNDLESIKGKLDDMTNTGKLVENASETVRLLGKQHYEEHVIEPLVRSLLSVLDLIDDARKHWDSSERVSELFNSIWSEMEQFLAIYDVLLIKTTAKEKFDPKKMKPIAWVPIDNKQHDGMIAESLQLGVQFGNVRMLRLETVSLFKYQPSETNSITLNERTES